MVHEDVTVRRDKWTLVAEGMKFVCVQMTGVGVALVRCVGAEDEDPDDADVSGALIENAGSSFAVGGLPERARVYVRSKRDNVETVNVLAY